ncbi:hypothetical protein ECC02_006501 [Trypanosoma cruzi]|uniref:K Homology domain-containing protein n=1 Tax=Trypanosoma cruzi TaxID=5693 RepID=A0A7J6Y1G5_TRYCR|nr:hypothetical protein ECC02_006501 [Trypanosoma cruzi]
MHASPTVKGKGKKQNALQKILLIGVGMPEAPTTLLSLPQLDLIADPHARSLLEEERGLRERCDKNREALRKILREKSSCISEHAPKVNSFVAEITSTIDALVLKKDNLIAELDKLKSLQFELSNLRRDLRVLEHDISTLAQAARDAEVLLESEMCELKRVREEREARVGRMRFATVEQAEKELHRLERELAKAGDENCNTAVNLSRRTQAARARQERQEIAALDARVLAQDLRVEKCRAEIEARTAERQEKEEAKKTLKEHLQALNEDPAKREVQFGAVRSELAKVQQELAEALRRRKEKRPASNEMDSLQKEHDALVAEMQADDKCLADLRKQLPFRTFAYPPELKMALVGKGGATLEQLQVDFGVAVCIDGVENGCGFVFGGEADVNAAIVAIGEIIAAEEACSHKVVLRYDAALRTNLIGKRGTNVRRIELESGAKLDVERDAVTLRGTQKAVEAARELVETFLRGQHRAEMPLLADEIPHVIGKNGTVINQMEKETGVRSLRVDREAQKIIAIGEQTRVEEAMRRYKELLADVRQSQPVAECDKTTQGDVAGSESRTVQDVEAATGVFGHVKDSMISPSGTSQSAGGARVLPHKAQCTEARVPMERSLMQLLTTALVEVNRGPGGDNEEKRELEAVANEENREEEPVGVKGAGEAVEKKERRHDKGTGSRALTPLQVIQQRSQCKHVKPVHSEGIICLCGEPKHIQHARMMLEEFALQYRPRAIHVYVPEILFTCITQPSGKKPSLVSEWSKGYSPLLSIELKPKEEEVIVGSFIAEEARAVAETVREFTKAKEESLVRRVRPFPQNRIGTLLGKGGKKLRELEKKTGTHIVLRRDAGEVQVFHADGDEAALAEAVDLIMTVAKL